MPRVKEPSLFRPLPVTVVDTPLGKIWVQSDGKLITRLSFDSIDGRRTKLPAVLEAADLQLSEYFRGDRTEFDLPLQQKGTRFQKLVWAQLRQIRAGETRTYKQIGNMIGGKGIARTVGGACGRNPIPLLVPCHRVIGSNGLLTGYVGGIWRKKWLLEHEGALQPELFA